MFLPNSIWFLTADALADTFYSVGFVMSLCQLLSILELFHIADGIEKARLLPRFIQVCIHSWLFNEILPLIVFCFVFLIHTWLDCLSIFQVMEKNLLLIMIIMLEEIQSKPVVCAQFFFWNILDLLRYVLQIVQECRCIWGFFFYKCTIFILCMTKIM